MYCLAPEDCLMHWVSTILVISAWVQIIQLAGVSWRFKGVSYRRLLCLLRQVCTCPSIVHATGVHFPSGAASHFGVSLTAWAKTCLYLTVALSMMRRWQCVRHMADTDPCLWCEGPQRRTITRNRSLRAFLRLSHVLCLSDGRYT